MTSLNTFTSSILPHDEDNEDNEIENTFKHKTIFTTATVQIEDHPICELTDFEKLQQPLQQQQQQLQSQQLQSQQQITSSEEPSEQPSENQQKDISVIRKQWRKHPNESIHIIRDISIDQANVFISPIPQPSSPMSRPLISSEHDTATSLANEFFKLTNKQQDKLSTNCEDIEKDDDDDDDGGLKDLLKSKKFFNSLHGKEIDSTGPEKLVSDKELFPNSFKLMSELNAENSFDSGIELLLNLFFPENDDSMGLSEQEFLKLAYKVVSYFIHITPVFKKLSRKKIENLLKVVALIVHEQSANILKKHYKTEDFDQLLDKMKGFKKNHIVLYFIFALQICQATYVIMFAVEEGAEDNHSSQKLQSIPIPIHPPPLPQPQPQPEDPYSLGQYYSVKILNRNDQISLSNTSCIETQTFGGYRNKKLQRKRLAQPY